MVESWTPALNLLTSIPSVCLLYFFYGLAFLFLGLAITVKDMRGSELKFANSLWLLAGFGFTHGAHEWLELYLILQGRYISVTEILYIKLITVSAVVVSFFLLLEFGIKLIQAVNNKWAKWLRLVPFLLFLLWALPLWNYGFAIDVSFFEMADMRARNTFGLIGGLTTAYGLARYSSEVKDLSPFASKSILYAGIAFIFYAFSAGIISSHTVIPVIAVPIEGIRGISAVFIACMIIKALSIFDAETRKKLENHLKLLAQSEKLASIGQLAAGIAHEINNPLTNASLNVQTLKIRLKDEVWGKEILQKLESVERNVDRASGIARELLEFSRQKETVFVPLNINKVIDETLTLLEYRLNNVTMHKRLSEVPAVAGDASRLRQVLINIISNAVEAMPDGGDIFVSSSHGGHVKVEVTDTGIGISEGHISKVFDPFFTTKDVGSGTGLGLSICYGIINQHNGTLEISSDEGKGTKVTIKLPAVGKT